MHPQSMPHQAALALERIGGTLAGCVHRPIVAGGRKPKDLPALRWVNIVLGNLKTSLAGTYHHFAFGKYAARYLAAVAYRFNRRFRLDTLPQRLLLAAIASRPCAEMGLRHPAEEDC